MEKIRKISNKIITIIMLSIIITSFTSCTDNQRIKYIGGKMEVSVPANEEFINATWKEDDLWIITRSKTKPNKYYMHEYSGFYVVCNGTVIISE